MLTRLVQPAFVSRALLSRIQHMSVGKRTLKTPLRGKSKPSTLRAPSPSAVPVAVEDAWTEVVDKASGQIYYWNTVTNETTALGAPKPGSSQIAPQQGAPQSGGMLKELGGVMAQGFAFGVGSSVAHSVVGSIFGGGGGHDDSSSGGGDDSFDV